MPGTRPPRQQLLTLNEIEVTRQKLTRSAGLEGPGLLLGEAARGFSVNVRDDGFTRTIAKAAEAAGGPCHFIVMTNLSMGMASLLNGLRIARYYGHSTTVGLTPHVWYGGAGDSDELFEQYARNKSIIARLRERNVRVIELSAVQQPEEVLPGRKAGRAVRRMR